MRAKKTAIKWCLFEAYILQVLRTDSQGGRVAVLLDMGLDYSQVKSMLLEGKMVGAIRAVPA